MIQKDIKKLNVNVIINHNVKENTQVKDILKSTIDGFYEKIGSETDVDIIVKEVKNFNQDGYIISNLDKDKFELNKYL